MKTQSTSHGSISHYYITSLGLSSRLLKNLCIESFELLKTILSDYRKNRENSGANENLKGEFPDAGFSALQIKKHTLEQLSKWPDKQGRYWWEITLKDGTVCKDYYWMKDENFDRDYLDKTDKDRRWFSVYHAPSNTKIEGFSARPDREKGYPDKSNNYWFYVQYTECGPIKQWMEEKDHNYLKRILKEDPKLFEREFAELKAANPKHPAISQIEAEIKKEREAKKDEEDRTKRAEEIKRA